MKKETINKTEDLFVDNCKICDKKITGHSEAQVNSRMEMHMRSHNKDSQKGEKK